MLRLHGFVGRRKPVTANTVNTVNGRSVCRQTLVGLDTRSKSHIGMHAVAAACLYNKKPSGVSINLTLYLTNTIFVMMRFDAL